MSSDGPAWPADFVEQMHLAVVEESWLFEVPRYIGDGHRPWQPTDCSRQLLAWFDLA